MTDSHHAAQHATPGQIAAAKAYAGRGLLSGRHVEATPQDVTVLRHSVVLSRPPEQVFQFCLGRNNFPAIMPDPISAIWTSTENGQLGGVYDFRWWMKKVVPVRWIAFIDAWDENREFSDLQLRGMFRYFHHTHTCEPDPQGCLYTDTIRFRSALGPRLDRLVLLPQMRSLFAKRHQRMTVMLAASPQ